MTEQVTTGKTAEKMIKRAQSAQTILSPLKRFSPFNTTLERDIPDDLVLRNKLRRYFYHNDPIVGAAIDLHAEFPLSSFEVKHEDKQVRMLFEEMVDYLNLFDFIVDVALEYWIVGEAFPFGFFDDPHDPTVWAKFILINPDFITVEASPLVSQGEDTIIKFNVNKALKTITEKHRNDPAVRKLYDNLPSDFKEYAKANKPITLNQVQISHIKRKGSYFSLRGISLIDRVMKLLMYKEKLRSAQYAIAERHIAPLELYLIGNDNQPATQEELEQFSSLVASIGHNPTKAIVYHHALQVQYVGASGQLLPVWQEMDVIDKEIMAGLMISSAFITGEGATFANASVALDVLIQRYLALRDRIARWLTLKVFAPICSLHKIYKPTTAELAHKVRMIGSRSLWLPEVEWEKRTLRDETTKINLLQQMAERGLVPHGAVLKMLGINPIQSYYEAMQEKKILQKLQQSTQKEMGEEGAGELLSSPPLGEWELGSSGLGGTEFGLGLGGSETEGLPSLPSMSGGEIGGGGSSSGETNRQRRIPPESHQPVELPSS